WLSLLWLIAAAGWAVWRWWWKPAGTMLTLIEAGLLVVTGIAFLSAAVAAPYKHAPWLVAWEWLILFVAVLLFRPLAVTPTEQRSFLAVIVATGVSLSAQAIYQYTIELPRNAALASNETELRKALSEELHMNVEPGSPEFEHARERFLADNVFASY